MKTPDAYVRGSIETASPERLVLALYDGALAAIGRAREALTSGAAGAVEGAHRDLVRAQNIVLELSFALDHDAGGSLSSSLEALYGFWHRALVEANLRKSAAPLDAVEPGLRSVRDAWAEACCGSGSLSRGA